jgi:hypothetical protein
MSSNPRIWTTEDAQQLTSLREAAGLDISILAKRHSLSVHHVRQLEEGGDDRFYSQAIKLQVGRKLLRALGGDLVELPEPIVAEAAAEPVPLTVPEPLHASAVVRDATQSTGLPVSPSRLWMPLGGVVLLALAWLGWQQTAQEPNVEKKSIQRIAANAQTAEPSAPVQSTEATTIVNVAASDAAAVTEPSAPVAMLQPVEAATEPAPVASSAAASAASASGSSTCAFGADPVRVSVFEPQKPGNYVYFEAQQAAQVCVKDAAQQTTVLDLSAGRGRTVRGTAPFEVVTERFDAVRIFYQGKMVAPGLLTAPHVMLRPQAIAASSAATTN